MVAPLDVYVVVVHEGGDDFFAGRASVVDIAEYVEAVDRDQGYKVRDGLDKGLGCADFYYGVYYVFLMVDLAVGVLRAVAVEELFYSICECGRHALSDIGFCELEG